MRRTSRAIAASAVIGFLAILLLSETPAAGRSKDHLADDGRDSVVGRNAPAAITSGLAAQGAGWIDAMENFYADPRVDNRNYFDDYRRPYGARPRKRPR